MHLSSRRKLSGQEYACAAMNLRAVIYQSHPTQTYPSETQGQQHGRPQEMFHHPAHCHIPGGKEVGKDKKERTVSQPNLVITTLRQLFKAAKGAEVGVDNRHQLMEAESVRISTEVYETVLYQSVTSRLTMGVTDCKRL